MDVCTIENKYGSLIIDSGQKPTIGLQAFAEYFSSLSGCVFMPSEKRFYIYNRNNGLWESQSQEAMISKISEEILDLARAEEIKDEFASMRRPAVIKDILVYLHSISYRDTFACRIIQIDIVNSRGRLTYQFKIMSCIN